MPRRVFWPLAVALLLNSGLCAADDEKGADPNRPINRLFGGIKILDAAEEEAQAFQSWMNGGIHPARIGRVLNGADTPVSIEQANEVLDKILFGPETTGEADARARLEIILKASIEQVDRICGLSKTQIDKLQLAGRGDIHRFFRRAEALRAQLPEAIKDGVSIELARETRDLHNFVRNGAVERGSMFAKSLHKMLTPERIADYSRKRAEAKPKIRELLPELIVER